MKTISFTYKQILKSQQWL